MTHPNFKAILRHNFYFANIDEEALEYLAQNLSTREYQRDEVVLWEDEPASGLYIIFSGTLKVVRVSAQGRELTLNILVAQDSFNAIAMFTHGNNPARVIALEKATLLYLDYAVVNNLLARSPNFSTALLTGFSGRIQELTNLLSSLSLQPVEGRLAEFLITKAKGDIFLREKWLTQDELAARIGTVPDVLSRILRSLVEEGLIEMDRRSIRILNRPALEARSGNAQFPT